MIKSKDFCKTLLKYNLGPIVQVPCSYFKDLFNYLLDSEEIELINPANEAIAIGIASGYYLSTEKMDSKKDYVIETQNITDSSGNKIEEGKHDTINIITPAFSENNKKDIIHPIHLCYIYNLSPD